LDFLTSNELLKIRTISKTWNQLVLNYSGLKRRLAGKNIDFDEDRNGVEKIVKFNAEVKHLLPFSRFNIEFDLAPFFELEIFIQNYRKLVTHLRLGRLHKEGLSDFQFEFLNSLPSIKHLSIGSFKSDSKQKYE